MLNTLIEINMKSHHLLVKGTQEWTNRHLNRFAEAFIFHNVIIKKTITNHLAIEMCIAFNLKNRLEWST